MSWSTSCWNDDDGDGLLMENVLSDDQGLLCPVCRTRQFSNRRTAGAKVALAPLGVVGVLAAPKRLQCLGCRTYLKGPPVPAFKASVQHVAGGGGAGAGRFVDGQVPVVVTASEWDGPATARMLRSAYPALTDAGAERMRAALRSGPVEVARLAAADAERLRERLIEHGFTVSPAEAPAAAVVDVVEQLERLADLLDRGVLTGEEFAAQKAKLLDA